jgi:hypothetical protein
MPTPKQQRRRALELLEASIDGCTEAIRRLLGAFMSPCPGRVPAARSQQSINNTADWSDWIKPSITTWQGGHGFTQTRRANDSKAAGRHLPHGSGDVGQDEGGGPVHEIQEHLVLHPRGHRAAAGARGRAAVGVDRRSAAKTMTDSVSGGRRRAADARGASPFDLRRATDRTSGQHGDGACPATKILSSPTSLPYCEIFFRHSRLVCITGG